MAVFYKATEEDALEVLQALVDIDCEESIIRDAYDQLDDGLLNAGFTYSNFYARSTVMVIGLASSRKEYDNSITHERKHLEAHIADALGLNPFGERIAYIAGEIAAEMFPVTREILCSC